MDGKYFFKDFVLDIVAAPRQISLHKRYGFRLPPPRTHMYVVDVQTH